MNHWLLLFSGNEGFAQRLEPLLRPNGQPLPFTGGKTEPIIDFELSPFKKGDLYKSAEVGSKQAFDLLWSDGAVKVGGTLRFSLDPYPDVNGRSADLLFALVTATAILRRPQPYPAFAATGQLGEGSSCPQLTNTSPITYAGDILAVNHVPEKLRAAISTMASTLVNDTTARLLFYPKANDSEIDNELRTLANNQGFELCPVSRLEEALAKLGIDLQSSWSGIPFRGLNTFEREHRRIFFGREHEVTELTEQLLKREEQGQPGVLILAASGAGKSSLVQAGLLPALEQWQDRPVYWQIWRPRNATDRNQASIINSVLACWSAEKELGYLNGVNNPETFTELAQALQTAMPASRRFVWVIDQLEELFTLGFSKEDACITNFCEFLYTLQQQGVCLIATLRNDFFPVFQDQPALSKIFGTAGQFLLPTNLSVSAIKRMIERPAQLRKIRYAAELPAINGQPGQDNLVERITQDVIKGGGQDTLPLLQFALAELYAAMESRQLQKSDVPDSYNLQSPEYGLNEMTHADYEHIGGLLGAIGQRASQLFQSLDLETQAALPRLLYALTIFREGDAGDAHSKTSYSAKPIKLSDFLEATPIRNLIDVLVNARLLVLDTKQIGSSDIIVRVAHEALLTHWEKAKKTLDDLSQDISLREHLLTEANTWQNSKRQEDLLLPNGKRLTDAEDLLGRRQNWLTDFEHGEELIEYIQASSQAEQERQAVESARIQEEQAKELAREREKTEQERLHAKKLKLRAWALGGVAFIAVGLGTFAWQSSVKSTAALSRSDMIQGSQLLHANRIEEGFAYLARSINNKRNSQSAEMAFSFLSRMALKFRTQSFMHQEKVHSSVFSPHGDRILTTSGKSVRLWDTNSNRVLGKPMDHGDSIRHAEFSPNGHSILTASNDKTARIWDVDTGHPLTPPLEHQAKVNYATFSPDGNRVVTASDDHTVTIWDAKSGRPLSPRMLHGDKVTYAEFSPNGLSVITASMDKTARVWDSFTGQPLYPPIMHYDGVLLAKFSPDGQEFITVSFDKTAQIWNTKTGLQLLPPIKDDSGFSSAQFSPDGRLIATSSFDRTVRIWNAETGLPITQRIKHEDLVNDVTFSPDGRYIATASQDKTARIWNASTGQPLAAPMKHDDSVSDVEFSPDGSMLSTASFDHSANLWKVFSSQALNTTLNHDDFVNIAKFSSDGRRIVTASNDKTARVWDAATGKPLTKPLKHDSSVLYAEFSPDGEQILTASDDHTTRIWNVSSGQELIPTIKHRARVFSAAFSPDGQHIVTASEDKTARVWAVTNGQPLTPPLEHSSSVTHAKFSPSGEQVITASDDYTARVWDAGTGQAIMPPLNHESAVFYAEFSPNGHQIVTASGDKTARIWDADSGQEITPSINHLSAVFSAKFSPNGRQIVTGSMDKTARIWDSNTGQALTPPMEHGFYVDHVEFCPEGRRIISASSDQTAVVWDVETGQPITPPMNHYGRVSHAEFSPDGNRILTSTNRKVYFWDYPKLSHVSSKLSEFISQLTNYRFNENGNLQIIETKVTSSTIGNWLAENSKGLNSEELYIIEWLLADNSERTVSLYGKLTVRELTQQLIDQNTVASLNQALDYWPGHPMALAKLAAATLRETKPESLTSVSPSARLWVNLALKYSPEDLDVNSIAKQVLHDLDASPKKTEVRLKYK